MGGFGLDGCRALTIREQREHGLSALYEADRFGRSSVVCRVEAQRQLHMIRANRRRGPCGAEPLAPGARKRRSGCNPKRVEAQRQLHMIRANRRRGPCGAEPLAPGARKRRSGCNPKRVGAQRQLQMVRANRRRGPCGAEPLAPGARKRRSGRNPKRVGAQRQLHMVRGNRRRGPCGAEPLAPGARKRRSGRKPKAGWSADSFIWFVRIGGEARVVPSRLLQEHERDGVDVNPKRVGAQRQIQR